MNILFLDYDGVVNTPIWNELGTSCNYGTPFQGRVNNFQAVQWVSEFCEKFSYDIVVTSSWRMDPKYTVYLRQGGLRETVKIIGRTPRNNGKCRGDEIQEWINTHRDIENFIILDDDSDMGHLKDHLIQCNSLLGFTIIEFEKAKKLHDKLCNSKS